MDVIRVIYHHEDAAGGPSPRKGWTGGAETYQELRTLAEEGVRFALDRDDLSMEHYVPERYLAAPA